MLQVLCYGSNDRTGKDDLPLMRSGQILIRIPAAPRVYAETVQDIAARGVTSFSVELIPRTTRAQGMDALSSDGHDLRLQGGNPGGGHVAANFPDADDRRGDDVTPGRVFVIGAGVAGLQAIAHGAAPGRGHVCIRHPPSH